ncbi:hypothetical protein [Bradyrhizobium cytisi]|uniref:Uncharacterized protein n=1 Tax=Bradyrhizobium cytisi TaxID=515489 RepID=A0A5S4X0A2_9BRAD|nr:hypothetical protein [Bradyrhizobium cytisi]TYL87387.1 hypothetical protein FXB38_04485 [Bradyrhizobium cytisi]
MPEMNGQQQFPQAIAELEELEELAARDAQRIAAREPVIRVEEPMPPSVQPFDQKTHDLLLKSIDQVTTDWVGQLEHTRQNSKTVEQLMLERAAKVRFDITALYLLGAAVQAEARRGDEVNAKIAQELDQLIEQRAG